MHVVCTSLLASFAPAAEYPAFATPCQVTGDNWATARAIAAKLGIDNIAAEVLPAGKAEKVKRMQAS